MAELTEAELLRRARARIAERRRWTNRGARQVADPQPEDAARKSGLWWAGIPVVNVLLTPVYLFWKLIAMGFIPSKLPSERPAGHRVHPCSPQAMCWDTHGALVAEIGMPESLWAWTLGTGVCWADWLDKRLRLESIPVRPTIDPASGLQLELSEDTEYHEKVARQRVVLCELERFREKHALLVATSRRLNEAAKMVFHEFFAASPYDLRNEMKSELLLTWCEQGQWRLSTYRLTSDECHAKVLQCFDRAITGSQEAIH